MENNLFNGLQVVSGETKSELLNQSTDIAIGFRGEVLLTKGNLTKIFSYWFSECYKNKYGFINCENWDWESGAVTLGGLPIDSLDQLKVTLSNSGLTTLSKSLEFDNEEIKKAIFLEIEKSQEFKKQFGKTAKNWRVLDGDQQTIVKLDFVIKNYDVCGSHEKYCFGIDKLDDDGESIRNYVPTLDELKEYRESLT